MVSVYLNRIATAVPAHEVHQNFVKYVLANISDERKRTLFNRMAQRSQIEHRYSVLSPSTDDTTLDGERFYVPGNFPDTKQRMKIYKKYAVALAKKALDELGFDAKKITHIITSCTGFYAPGVDLEIMHFYGIPPTVELYFISFMGCYAGLNALKMAYHIVRSTPKANVLIVNLELCSLHLQANENLEQLLLFLLFADGCAASIVSGHRQVK